MRVAAGLLEGRERVARGRSRDATGAVARPVGSRYNEGRSGARAPSVFRVFHRVSTTSGGEYACEFSLFEFSGADLGMVQPGSARRGWVRRRWPERTEFRRAGSHFDPAERRRAGARGGGVRRRFGVRRGVRRPADRERRGSRRNSEGGSAGGRIAEGRRGDRRSERARGDRERTRGFP